MFKKIICIAVMSALMTSQAYAASSTTTNNGNGTHTTTVRVLGITVYHGTRAD